MKNKIVITLLLVAVCISCINAQNAEFDSLKLVDKNFKLNENYKTDTSYLQNANLLSFQYLQTNPDTVIVISKEVILLSKNINYYKGVAVALRRIGIAYKYISEIDSSLFYLEKSYEQFSIIDNQMGMSKINFDLAAIYKIQGNSELAIENYEKVLIYFTKINNSLYIAITLNNIAVVYQMQGRLTEAIQYYYKILELFEKNNNKAGLISAYNNIGIVLEIQKKYDEALLNYEKSLEISTELNRFFEMTNTMSNISNIYLLQQKYNKALLQIKQAVEINIKSNNSIGEANNYMQICELYCKTENYDSAKVYVEKSKILNKELRDKILEYKILYYGANIDYSENKIETALEKALDAHNLIIKVGDVEKQREVNLLICKLYETNNNYEKSLFYYKNYKLYSDSITKNDNLKKTELIQAEYEYLQKETNLLQENEKHLQEITKQRYTILIFVIALVAIFIILLLIYRKKQQKQKDYLLLQNKNIQIKEQSEEIKQQAEGLITTNEKLVELDKYKQSVTNMIVHDLKNPLSSIIYLSKNETVIYSANQMYNLVNNMLDVSKFEEAKMQIDNIYINLHEVVRSAFNHTKYVVLQKNIKFVNNVKSNIFVFTDKDLVERILINLINNASKFSDNNGNITINSEIVKNKILKISVTDTGRGISEDNLDKIFDRFSHTSEKNEFSSTGLGLTFCKMAIHAMNEKIGVESKIDKGSVFWFTLPFAEKYEEIAIQIIEGKDSPSLNNAELEILKPFIKKIREFEIFEISLIKAELNKLQQQNNSKNIKEWIVLFEDTIYNSNISKYNNMLTLT